MHHVGGRGGKRSFPILKKFEQDITNVLYEADSDSIEQIIKKNQTLESTLHVLPYCLAERCKTAAININYDPYTSSIHETNKDFDQFYMFYVSHDYITSETTKAMEKREIEMVSLDHLFQSEAIDVPKPDFLSIDVEGGEYEVLQGATETMGSAILSVYSEVTFHPFRKDQKLFGDLCEFLADYGFYFVAFKKQNSGIFMEELSPYRYPIGLRGNGFDTLSEALFLRKIDYVKSMFKDRLDLYISLRKLAFISMVFHQFEYALECLRESSLLEIDFKQCEEEKNVTYCRFLREIEVEANKTTGRFPPTFATKYTFEQSKARFEINKKPKADINKEYFKREEIKRFLKKYFPSLLRIMGKARLLIGKARLLVTRIQHIISSRNKKSVNNYSNVEKILTKYELYFLADIIRNKRIQQSHFTEPN